MQLCMLHMGISFLDGPGQNACLLRQELRGSLTLADIIGLSVGTYTGMWSVGGGAYHGS